MRTALVILAAIATLGILVLATAATDPLDMLP